MTKSIPVTSGLNLVARDMDATLAFYRELGVVIPVENIWLTESGVHHVEPSTKTGLQTPYDAFWGARDAVVEDPTVGTLA